MKIRNKTTGRELEVSDRLWKNMKAAGASKVFEVVLPPQPTIQSDACRCDLPSREQMLIGLREKGIRTSANIGQEKLTERYKLNI
jgi:hypothetical protein